MPSNIIVNPIDFAIFWRGMICGSLWVGTTAAPKPRRYAAPGASPGRPAGESPAAAESHADLKRAMEQPFSPDENTIPMGKWVNMDNGDLFL